MLGHTIMLQWRRWLSGWSSFGQSTFDRVMNTNVDLLIGATGLPHFTRHYVLLRTHEIRGSDCNGSS